MSTATRSVVPLVCVSLKAAWVMLFIPLTTHCMWDYLKVIGFHCMFVKRFGVQGPQPSWGYLCDDVGEFVR